MTANENSEKNRNAETLEKLGIPGIPKKRKTKQRKEKRT